MRRPAYSSIPMITLQTRGGEKTFDAPYGKDYLGEFTYVRMGTSNDNCDGSAGNSNGNI